MRVKKLILLGLIISTNLLQAQNSFRPGYVIENTGDTLYGNIDYRGDMLMSHICKFKDENDNIIVYTPNDLMAFRFLDSKYYISKELEKEKVFLEYLIKGQVSIYYMRNEKGNHYFVESESYRLTEIPYEEGIKYTDDKKILYQSSRHIGLLMYYMQDVPELEPSIKRIVKPNHENLIKLAQDYHNTVCEGKECLIYEKQQPLLKVNVEVLAGVVNFKNAEELTDKNYIQSGVLIHSWMPRANEKIYFRTGILYAQLESEGRARNYFKIPLQLEYIYPKSLIRPRLSYGPNIYIPAYYSLSLNLGVNIRINNSLFFTITSDIEFTPLVALLPKELLANSGHLGIFYEFK